MDTLEVDNGNNVAYTVIPAHDNVVKILTESEDHTTRGTYTINLAVSGSTNNDPTDGSRDYDYTNTTATAASQQLPQPGSEGPVKLAFDNNSHTVLPPNSS